MKLTIYYDGQYWVGVIEETEGSKVKACRHIFGSEPKYGEVLEFVLKTMIKLLEKTTQYVETGKFPIERRISPKRLSRLFFASRKCSVLQRKMPRHLASKVFVTTEYVPSLA